MIKKISLLLFIAVLSSCASSGGNVVDKLYYRFAESQISYSGQAIKINKPAALGILGGRPMVVANSEGSLQQMNQNFWLESPKTLYWSYLKESFSSDVKNQKNLTLHSEIRRFEKNNSNAIVEIAFQLTNMKNETVFEKSYNQTEASVDNSIPSFVKSSQIAIEKITRSLAKDITDVN